jgi:hypothetical protein
VNLICTFQVSIPNFSNEGAGLYRTVLYIGGYYFNLPVQNFLIISIVWKYLRAIFRDIRADILYCLKITYRLYTSISFLFLKKFLIVQIAFIPLKTLTKEAKTDIFNCLKIYYSLYSTIISAIFSEGSRFYT